MSATDRLYTQGMAGLMAGGGSKQLSTPYFDNNIIKGINAPEPEPTSAAQGQGQSIPHWEFLGIKRNHQLSWIALTGRDGQITLNEMSIVPIQACPCRTFYCGM